MKDNVFYKILANLNTKETGDIKKQDGDDNRFLNSQNFKRIAINRQAWERLQEFFALCGLGGA